MSEGELRDQYIARLVAERDRLVAGCRATADWLDGLVPRGVDAEVDARIAGLRQLFLTPVRYSDGDSVEVLRYGREEF